MPMLTKPRWEKFAQSVAAGQSATQAYIAAGFSRHGAAQAAYKLLKRPLIADRVIELQRAERQAQITAAKVREQTRDELLRQLQVTVERCMQHEPVLDRRGRPVMVVGPDGKLHAHYRFDARNAIDSLTARQRAGHVWQKQGDQIVEW
jgi:crotonobetainyl-CoA:carnitine CoA-transferase CaiB-like acyl-CoA transferase